MQAIVYFYSFNTTFKDKTIKVTYKTITLPVTYIPVKHGILHYGRLRILRRIFGPKRDQNEEWGRLHNKKLHSLYG